MIIDWRDPDARSLRTITLLTALRWTAAGAVVVAAQGGAVWAALNWQPALAASGEPPPAVMIELAPVAVSPDVPEQDVAPGPQMTEAQPEQTPDVPDKPVDKPDDKPQPVTQIDTPKLPEKPNADTVVPPQPTEAPKTPPKDKQPERKKPINPDKTKAPQTTAPRTSPNPRADRAAAPSSSAAATPSTAPASWKGALMARLNQFKRFPPGAASDGTAIVAFTIGRSGQVTAARLVRSSGDGALDGEAVSLPRRASPVPPPPPEVSGSSITLAVPIRFGR